jgi:hypothetical protein
MTNLVYVQHLPKVGSQNQYHGLTFFAMLADAAHEVEGSSGHILAFSQSVIKYNLNIIIPNVQRAIKSPPKEIPRGKFEEY